MYTANGHTVSGTVMYDVLGDDLFSQWGAGKCCSSFSPHGNRLPSAYVPKSTYWLMYFLTVRFRTSHAFYSWSTHSPLFLFRYVRNSISNHVKKAFKTSKKIIQLISKLMAFPDQAILKTIDDVPAKKDSKSKVIESFGKITFAAAQQKENSVWGNTKREFCTIKNSEKCCWSGWVAGCIFRTALWTSSRLFCIKIASEKGSHHGKNEWKHHLVSFANVHMGMYALTSFKTECVLSWINNIRQLLPEYILKTW